MRAAAWRLRLLALFLGASSFRQLLLCVAPHLHERIDEIVDRLMPFCLAPHPDQRVEKVINGFGVFGHTRHSSSGKRTLRVVSRGARRFTSVMANPAQH